MNVFSGMGPESIGKAMAERCKRDYEADIARAREAMSTSIGLKEALERYIDVHGPVYYDNQNSVTLPALYGALALEVRSQDRLIENLIAEQEREAK